MARLTIPLDPFSPQSVAQAARLYREALQRFEEQVQEFLREIAELGAQEAQTRYGFSVLVTVQPIENGYAVSADGDAVVFLEFGAGAATNSGNTLAQEMPFDVRRGSYSDLNQGEYQATGYRYWHFGGVKYTEVQPRNAMESAYRAMLDQWQDIARSVFA